MIEMIDSIEDIKKEIAEWESEKVEVIAENIGNGLYNTIVDVYYDERNGCTFTVLRNVNYDDTLIIIKELYEGLRFAVKTLSLTIKN